jgi:hypothetical protein
MHPHIGMIILTVVLTLFGLRILRRLFWRRHFYRYHYGLHGGPHGYHGCGGPFDF